MRKKFYAVRRGRISMTIVHTWEECSELVLGHPGARFKGFSTEKAAQDFLDAPEPKRVVSQVKPVSKPQPRPTWDADKYPCLERKTYRDPIKGIRYKNRCVRRGGPAIVGKDFDPVSWAEFLNTDEVPWDV